MIVNVYLESVSGAIIPLHGCWVYQMHLYNMQFRLASAFEYVF